MNTDNNHWVDELFLILAITATREEWQQKFDETMHSLKHEVQFMISTLNNNEQQLIQEAQKRATSFYINGSRSKLTAELKVAASEILLRNQQPELALSVLQPIDMDAEADYFINFGRALMQIGILDQARQCFINALDRAPESAEPLFHLGFHSGLSGDVESSARFYKESLELDPKHMGSLLNLAYLSYQMEKFEEAIGYCRNALELDKNRIGAYLTICACLNATRRFSESAVFLEKAREGFGTEIAELDELEAVIRLELQQYPEAIEAVTRYLSGRPSATDLLYIRARANTELSNWTEALTDIDELLSLEPFDTLLLEMRFNTLMSAKHWNEAEIAYIRLLENAPQLRIKYQKEYTELRKNLALFMG